MRNSLAKHRLFAFTIIFLIAAIQPAAAQTPEEQHPEDDLSGSWVDEVPCKDKPDKEKLAFFDGRQFRICFDFSADKLQPASDGSVNTSDLLITTYAEKGQPNLTQLSATRLFPEGYPGLILGNPVPAGPEESLKLSTRRLFKVSVGVTPQMRTGCYPIRVAAGKTTGDEGVDFTLPVLVPTNTSVLVKQKNQSIVACLAGSNCSTLELEVQNKLPYKVSIANITITSDDLLDSKPTSEYLRTINTNSAPLDLPLVMKANPISLSRVLSGFGQPKLTFRIDYLDEYGRSFSTESQPANFEMRPNLLMIGLFLVAGAAIGTYLRRDPGKFQQANLTSSKQRWCFIGTTFLTGILICLLAVWLEIKIVVLNSDNSLSAWDPKMLLFTAFVATFGGLPLIYAYFKIPQPKDSPDPALPKPDAPGK